MSLGAVKRILVLLALLLPAHALAQPVTIAWRPPSGCSSTQVIQWSGTAWTCGSVTTLSGLTTNRVLKAGSASTAVNTAFPIDDAAALLTLGDSATDVIAANGELVVGNGTYGTSAANGMHFSFAANVGTITSAQPGTAYRGLVLDGSSVVLKGDSNTALTISGNTGQFANTLGVTGLLTATAGVTTPADFTTTGTGDVVSADDVTVGDLLDVNGDLAKFGSTDGLAYVYLNGLSFNYNDNATATGYINFHSYQGGLTQFRDLVLADGKGVTACTLTGSTKVLNCVGGLQENGAAVLSGTITANVIPKGSGGNLTDSGVVDNGSEVTMAARNLSVGGNVILTQAADIYMYASLATSSGNQALNVNSAGSSPIRLNSNQGGIVNAGTGGVAIYGGNGDSSANWSVDGSGNTTQIGNLSTDQNLTAGNATTDAHAFSGRIVSTETVGNTLSASAANLDLKDDTSMALGVGAGIALWGNYTGTTGTQGALIKLAKTNGTDTNFAFDLLFSTRANGSGDVAERMRIDATGNVGIGTDTTPDYLLDVQGTFNADGDVTLGDGTTDNVSATGLFTALDTVGTSINPLAGVIVRDDTAYAQGVGGGIYFSGKYNGAGSYNNGPIIKAMKTTATDGDASMDLVFGTPNAGTTPVERMRISSAGSVGIGTDTTPDFLLDVQGTFNADGAATFLSTVAIGNDSTDLATFSNSAKGANLNYSGKHLEWAEEFINNLNARTTTAIYNDWLGAAVSGTGSQIAAVDPATATGAGRIGVVSLSTGSTSSGSSSLETGEIAHTGNSDVWTWEASVYFDDLSVNGSQEYYVYTGFYNVRTADGCVLVYDTDGNFSTGGLAWGNKWVAICSLDGTMTIKVLDGTGGSTDSPVAADTWYRAKVIWSNGSAGFYVDGTLRYTISTNVPSLIGDDSDGVIAIIKSLGSTARSVWLDHAYMYVDLNATRTP